MLCIGHGLSMQNLHKVTNSFVIICSIHVYAGLHKETPTVEILF